MQYLIETTGPLTQKAITEAVLAYMNYPSYLPPGRPTQVARLGSPLPGVWPVQGAFQPRHFPGFSAGLGVSRAAIQSATGTPMVLQMGNTIEVAPGIRLRQLSNLGRTYQDLFFWSATGRTHVLGVSGRGAHHEWTTLPHGWDNHAFANAPAAELGRFTPGQTLPAAVTHLTTAQKVGEAMYRSVKYMGEEAKPILLQLISPQAIGYVLAIEALYTVSLFFGVGEVVTLVLVVAGVYFVGQTVVEVIESLVAFVQRATAAKSEADLEAAAKHFAHALTLGVDIVAGLLTRKMSRPGRPTVLRAKAQGGGRKKLAAEVKPLEPTKPRPNSERGAGANPNQASVPTRPVPYRPLTPKQKAELDRKLKNRTITKEEYARLEWDRRFNNKRSRGVSRYWAEERKQLRRGEAGTRKWTEEQRADIIAGRVPKHNGEPIEGHHKYNALDHPQAADDPRNIYPATKLEHLRRWHGGDFKKDTKGVPLDPKYPEDF